MLFTLFGDLVLFFNKIKSVAIHIVETWFVLGLKLDFEFWPDLRFKHLKGEFWNWYYNLTFLLMDKILRSWPHIVLSLEWNMLIFLDKSKKQSKYKILNVCYIKKELYLMYCLGAKWSSEYMSNHNLCGAWDPQRDCAACYDCPLGSNQPLIYSTIVIVWTNHWVMGCHWTKWACLYLQLAQL